MSKPTSNKPKKSTKLLEALASNEEDDDENEIVGGYVPLSIKLWDHIILLRKERDEARKIVCQLLQEQDSGSVTCQRLAEDRGWDCYKKEETP